MQRRDEWNEIEIGFTRNPLREGRERVRFGNLYAFNENQEHRRRTHSATFERGVHLFR